MFIDPIYLAIFLVFTSIIVSHFIGDKRMLESEKRQSELINKLTDDLFSSSNQISTMQVELSLVKKELYKLNSKRNSTLPSAKKLSLSVSQSNA